MIVAGVAVSFWRGAALHSGKFTPSLDSLAFRRNFYRVTLAPMLPYSLDPMLIRWPRTASLPLSSNNDRKVQGG